MTLVVEAFVFGVVVAVVTVVGCYKAASFVFNRFATP